MATNGPVETGMEISREELLAELNRLYRQLGTPPTMREMDFQGRYAASTYQYRFESWNAALRAAEIPTQRD